MIEVKLVQVLQARKSILKQLRRVFDLTGIRKEDLEILGWISREALEAGNEWTHLLVRHQGTSVYELLEVRSVESIEKSWHIKPDQIFVV